MMRWYTFGILFSFDSAHWIFTLFRAIGSQEKLPYNVINAMICETREHSGEYIREDVRAQFINGADRFFAQLSFTVASIIFFTFYIPHQYCTAQERDTLMKQFSSYFMSTAKEFNSTEEQEKNEQKLLLSLCARLVRFISGKES